MTCPQPIEIVFRQPQHITRQIKCQELKARHNAFGIHKQATTTTFSNTTPYGRWFVIPFILPIFVV